MRYRSRAEIINQILEIAKGEDGAAKTAIIYRAFLSYRQFKEYLTILTESNLLNYDQQARVFKITEKALDSLTCIIKSAM